MKTDRFLYLFPRYLCIGYVLFLSLFAFDVFVPGYSAMYYFTAFAIHLIPCAILALFLYLSWHDDKAGIVLFTLAFMIAYFTYSSNKFSWSNLALFLPLLLISFLFSVDLTSHNKES